MIVEIVVCITTAAILSYFYWTKNYKYWEERGVPCAPAEFPWGSLKGVDPFKENCSQYLQSLYNLHDSEPVIGFYGPTEPFLLIKDLNMVKSVLISDFKSFHTNGYRSYASTDPMMRYNAFGTQSMTEWKNIRRIHSHLFTQTKVRPTVPQMMKNTKAMIQFIRDHSDENLNATSICWKFNVDSVLNIGFGVHHDSFKDDTKLSFTSPDIFFGSEWSSNAASFCSFFLPWLALILRCSTIGKTAENLVREWANSLMEQRKKENSLRVDVIQRIIEKTEKDKQQNIPEISDAVKTAQYMTFMIDGFETSSAALTFAIYDLAKHSEVQERLRQEILAVGYSIDDFNSDNIQSLKYLNDCMTESLRLRTALPVVTRYCTEDTTLGTLAVSKGTKVFIPIHAIQTDSKHFPDPLSYNPERFAHMDSTKHPALYSFGDGPRICLGMRHAQMNLKIALIALLLKFKIDAVNELELDTSFFFCRPKPVNLKFKSLYRQK